MAGILKVSEAAVLAFHTVALLAGEPERIVTTGEIASALDASEAHLSKVLQRLAKSGIVTSARGPKGGFTLGKAPGEITFLDIYEVIDGPLTDVNCLLGAPICDGECILGDLLETLNTLVRERLETTRLSDVRLHLAKRPKETAGSS
ncbi:MAG: Rrf2 family transcriptional regulator [Planctomycetes bacterium]|nr:Rrf2 family transcriptional regulator [Planctomycetota bacterium]